MERLLSRFRAIVDHHGLDDPYFLTALVVSAALLAALLVSGAAR